MSFKEIFFLIIIISNFSFSKSYQNSKDANSTMKLEKIFDISDNRVVKMFPLDLEKDGFDELLLLFKEEQINCSIRFYRKFQQQILGQRNYSKEDLKYKPKYSFAFYFKTPSGESRISIITKEENKIFLEILNSNLDLVYRQFIIEGKDINNSGSWDGYAHPVAAVDLNKDGTPELIIEVQTAYDRLPRGIWAVDIKRKKIEWVSETGTVVINTQVEDLDGDGNPEIIFGGGAPNNGASINGTDDSHSYLIILNERGEKIWLQETGGSYSRCFPIVDDLRGDGQKKIITLFQNRSTNEPATGRITIRDAKTRSIEHEYSSIANPTGFCISDINLDGKKEIIVGTHSIPPELVVLSDILSLMKKIDLPCRIHQILTEDLNMDGKKEVIVSSQGSNRTLVLNNNLEFIADYPFGGNLHLVHQGYDQPVLLAIQRENQGISFLEMKKTVISKRYPIQILFLGFISGVFIVILITIVFQGNRPGFCHSKIMITMLEKLNIGIMWVNNKGKIKCHNLIVLSLFQVDQMPQTISEANSLFQKTIIFNHNKNVFLKLKEPIMKTLSINNKEISMTGIPFKTRLWYNGYVIILQDATQQYRFQRIMLWTGLAQKLAHEIKNPLSTVLLTLQRLQMAYREDQVKNFKQYDQYAESAIEEVERLRRVTDGFMKFMRMKQPEFKIVPAVKVLKTIEERVYEWLPDKVHFKLDYEKELPDIFIDLDQIQTLFFNLFDNAVKAMKGKGHLNLNVRMTEWIQTGSDPKGKSVILFEISDTGEGVSKDKLIHLFEPYISFREGGTGLGLNICKGIIEDHKGKIWIDSKQGIGTTVFFELPFSD